MQTRIRLETDLDEDSNDTIQRATLMRAHQSSSQKNGEETWSTSELDGKTSHSHKTVEKKTDSGLRIDHIRGQFIIEADIFNSVGVWVRSGEALWVILRADCYTVSEARVRLRNVIFFFPNKCKYPTDYHWWNC
ncbi:hypothetical protein J1N35_044538 [Gossypium stocksii]|uniref:Uncharacterized protein n=1 Tax=Gossypium stocksii TaxID=47602 RepID=A0A9D3U9F2_9ROSI|nr:hypothetical protein J1N35_044538 [Gossypium stocksii]